MSDSELPSLNAIRTFAVVARHGSFSSAAMELHVTQGAVSRMMRALEQELGVPLFRRLGRFLELTPAGAAYHSELAPALERIASATRSLRALDSGNVLSIAVLPTFAMRWFMPRLKNFQSRHPHILVDVTLKDGIVDFNRERIDVAICYGLDQWPDQEATLLMQEEVGVFCSPEFLKRNRRTLRGPSDLPCHPLLRHSTRPNAWEHYGAAFGIALENAHIIASFEHFFMIIEASANSMGLALLPLFLVSDELASARLVQPFPQTIHPREGYYITHRPHAASAKKVRLFKAWLLREVFPVEEKPE